MTDTDTETLERLQGLEGTHADWVWHEAKVLFQVRQELGPPISIAAAFKAALDRWDEYEANRDCSLTCCDLFASSGWVDDAPDAELHAILSKGRG